MWNRLPAQVRCMRQGAQGWCTGMTLSDEMGREVGRRVRMGNTCTPMANSCECMAKPAQYCKVINLQLKKKRKDLGFLSGSVVKNPPAMQEVWVQSMGQEDPWRRKWQPTSIFLPGKSTWIEEPGGYTPWVVKGSDTTWWLNSNTEKELVNDIIWGKHPGSSIEK